MLTPCSHQPVQARDRISAGDCCGRTDPSPRWRARYVDTKPSVRLAAAAPAIIALIVFTALALKTNPNFHGERSIVDCRLIGVVLARCRPSTGSIRHGSAAAGVGFALVAAARFRSVSLVRRPQFFRRLSAATDANGKHNVLREARRHGAQSVDRQTKLIPMAYPHPHQPGGTGDACQRGEARRRSSLSSAWVPARSRVTERQSKHLRSMKSTRWWKKLPATPGCCGGFSAGLFAAHRRSDRRRPYVLRKIPTGLRSVFHSRRL